MRSRPGRGVRKNGRREADDEQIFVAPRLILRPHPVAGFAVAIIGLLAELVVLRRIYDAPELLIKPTAPRPPPAFE